MFVFRHIYKESFSVALKQVSARTYKPGVSLPALLVNGARLQLTTGTNRSTIVNNGNAAANYSTAIQTNSNYYMLLVTRSLRNEAMAAQPCNKPLTYNYTA
jgi:hypothetical protein